MFNVLGDLNWPAVAAATLAYYILGALWFTPLFGKAYDKATGVERKKSQKWAPIYYIGPLINCFLVTLTTAVLLQVLQVSEFSDAILFGHIVGLGYLASVTFNNAITPNMPKPLLFGLVTGFYHLLGAIMVSGLLFTLS